MPLTSKGNKILSAMEKEYGAEKAKRVFYASANKGTISGIDPKHMRGGTIRYRAPKKAGGGEVVSDAFEPITPGQQYATEIRKDPAMLGTGRGMPSGGGGGAAAASRASVPLTPAESRYFSGMIKNPQYELSDAVPSIRMNGNRLEFDRAHSGSFFHWIDESRALRGPGEPRLPPSFYRPSSIIKRFEGLPDTFKIEPLSGLASGGPVRYRKDGGGEITDNPALREIAAQRLRAQSLVPPGTNLGPADKRQVQGSQALGISDAVPRGPVEGPAWPKPGERYAMGGAPSKMTPWYERGAARNLAQGMLRSTIPGRTDRLPLQVHSGSYVLPADHVSALGQNNSEAGAKAITKMFSGSKMNSYGGGRFRMPGVPGMHRGQFAKGGGTKEVPIVAAGGEYVLSPEQVAMVGDGDMKKGHDILDRWVMDMRKKHIKTLRTLKPPRKN